MRRVLPFIQPEYFEGIYSTLFKETCKYVAKYNKLPNQESFKIELDDTSTLTDEQYREAVESIPSIFTREEQDAINNKELMRQLEEFVNDKPKQNEQRN